MNREGINARCNLSYIEFIKNKVSHEEAFNITPVHYRMVKKIPLLYTILLVEAVLEISRISIIALHICEKCKAEKNAKKKRYS